MRTRRRRRAATRSDGHGLTVPGGTGATYDQPQKERELVQVTVTRRCLPGNQSRWYRFPWGLPGSSPAVAAGLVAAAATFMESAAGAIIIFQGSMRTSAQNTNACIGQNAGCMYSSSLQCNAQEAQAFHFQQIIVPDFWILRRHRRQRMRCGNQRRSCFQNSCGDLIDVRPAPCKPISATRTFNTPSDTPSYRRPGSRISGTSEVLADLGHYKQVATCDGLKRTSSARCGAGREEHIRWRMKVCHDHSL